MSIIKTSGLSFYYTGAKTKNLDDVSLDVPYASIYGFLGPNGAGKTTTLRLLLGLLKKQQGHIELFGKELGTSRIEILSKLGSLIEQPSLYTHLTAKENLKIYSHFYQCSSNRINEVLKIVGLEHTGSKKTKHFSLGMKQRLSIGIALLHEPELLILDEPTNGLDPNGIIEIRELIKKLNKENGITVIISSHILNEVERMATHVGIINKGKLLFQGTLSELQQLKLSQSTLEIETDNNAAALQLLQPQYNPLLKQDKISVAYHGKNEAAAIASLLVQNGLRLYALYPPQDDLEKLFIDITSNHS